MLISHISGQLEALLRGLVAAQIRQHNNTTFDEEKNIGLPNVHHSVNFSNDREMRIHTCGSTAAVIPPSEIDLSAITVSNLRQTQGVISRATPLGRTHQRDRTLYYLAICYKFGRYVRMFHTDIIIKDDREQDDQTIFTNIRNDYFLHQGKVRAFFSWYKLGRIERVTVQPFVFSILTFLKVSVVF